MLLYLASNGKSTLIDRAAADKELTAKKLVGRFSLKSRKVFCGRRCLRRGIGRRFHRGSAILSDDVFGADHRHSLRL